MKDAFEGKYKIHIFLFSNACLVLLGRRKAEEKESQPRIDWAAEALEPFGSSWLLGITTAIYISFPPGVEQLEEESQSVNRKETEEKMREWKRDSFKAAAASSRVFCFFNAMYIQEVCDQSAQLKSEKVGFYYISILEK